MVRPALLHLSWVQQQNSAPTLYRAMLLHVPLYRRYPEMVAPLITERDLYLAWSLKRSKAVCGARCVVGVMGRGHLRGVVHALANDAGGDALRWGRAGPVGRLYVCGRGWG